MYLGVPRERRAFVFLHPVLVLQLYIRIINIILVLYYIIHNIRKMVHNISYTYIKKFLHILSNNVIKG